jgi:hypothetical protein
VSVWALLQTKDLPSDSLCGMTAAEWQANVWHAWNVSSGYCDYHHLGGLKAPVARVVVNRRIRDQARGGTAAPSTTLPVSPSAAPASAARSGAGNEKAPTRANG